MITTKDRLIQIMQERGLKQKDIYDLAQPYCKKYNERLGAADISAYVNGKYFPTQKKLTLLGLALNVSEAWLMGLDVPMERQRKKPDTEDGAELDANRQFLLDIIPQLPDSAVRLLRAVVDQVLAERDK